MCIYVSGLCSMRDLISSAPCTASHSFDILAVGPIVPTSLAITDKGKAGHTAVAIPIPLLMLSRKTKKQRNEETNKQQPYPYLHGDTDGLDGSLRQIF